MSIVTQTISRGNTKTRKTSGYNEPNTWFELLDSQYARVVFFQIQGLWTKYGKKYSKWFDGLPPSQKRVRVCQAKLNFISQSNSGGCNISKHVPVPAGVVVEGLCLMPELITHGPCFDELTKDKLKIENEMASSWISFLLSRLDPGCFLADIKFCAQLHAVGCNPLLGWDVEACNCAKGNTQSRILVPIAHFTGILHQLAQH